MTDPGYSLTVHPPHLALPDFYSSMSAMNRAALVSLHEDGLIPGELAARIGAALETLDERERQPDAPRSHDYLVLERALIAAVGPEATRLHLGRSRQDMLTTGVSLWLRAAHLTAVEDLLPVQHAILDLAARHIETVMPMYTHGVQAQPTSVAHYLLAFVASLGRVADRLTESYARTNLSPLGAGAGTTSAFALNRSRLADLLGFDGIVDNSFDANLVAPIDTTLEFVSILSTLAVLVAQLTQDLHTQFYLTEPWLVLSAESRLTGISSMMPQKRNPRVLELLREHSSIIVGSATSMLLLAHNVTSGQTDVRETVTTVVPIGKVHELLFLTQRTVDAIVIDPERSLGEVDRDYSTMTNLAEYLVEAEHIPFREAHEFASQLTDVGRQRRLAPAQIPYADAARIFQELLGRPLPVGEPAFRAAIDPRQVIATRRGQGGPQRAEVERMLAEANATVAGHERWLRASRAALDDARATLDAAFGRVQTTATPRTAQARALS